jgi:uncharacterized protein YecE (DUF72 family)
MSRVAAEVTVRIGTSGWSYDHWHPELYPLGLPAASRLALYADAFPTVELNSSFYRWPRPAAFRSWRDRLPADFLLSVKAPRGLTHARKLYAPETWLHRIQAGWHELGTKRAVLLVQLPPAQPRDDLRLAYFLRQVPGWIRVAVEFRHPSWHVEEIFALLAEHRAAYCVMVLVDPARRQLPVSLQLADGPPEEPVRVHLDLYTSEQARQVERLVTLGATRAAKWPYPDDADFIVMRDPDGNEFCVIDHSGQPDSA